MSKSLPCPRAPNNNGTALPPPYHPPPPKKTLKTLEPHYMRFRGGPQINALSEASERKAKRLPSQQHTARVRNMKLKKRMDRTSRIMIAVLLLFLATEFPQGILGLLSGVLGKCFFRTCYNLFGELMDMLALLNASLNFVFYCCMSKQFRVAFGQLFRARPSVPFRPNVILETFV